MSTELFSRYGITAHIKDVLRGEGMHYLFIETGRTYKTPRGALRAARAYYRRKFKKLGIQPTIIRRRRKKPICIKERTGLIVSYFKDGEELFYVAHTGREWDNLMDAVDDVFAYIRKVSLHDRAEQDSSLIE